jgi:hypothetical protein
MTGQKDALNKLKANGLTFGLDYKLDEAAIVGGATPANDSMSLAIKANRMFLCVISLSN